MKTNEEMIFHEIGMAMVRTQKLSKTSSTQEWLVIQQGLMNKFKEALQAKDKYQ